MVLILFSQRVSVALKLPDNTCFLPLESTTTDVGRSLMTLTLVPSSNNLQLVDNKVNEEVEDDPDLLPNDLEDKANEDNWSDNKHQAKVQIIYCN